MNVQGTIQSEKSQSPKGIHLLRDYLLLNNIFEVTKV